MKAPHSIDRFLGWRHGNAARTLKAATALFFVMMLLIPPAGTAMVLVGTAAPVSVSFGGATALAQLKCGRAGEDVCWAVVADEAAEQNAAGEAAMNLTSNTASSINATETTNATEATTTNATVTTDVATITNTTTTANGTTIANESIYVNGNATASTVVIRTGIPDAPWSIAQMGADVAIVNNITGKGVRVALIDTGVDYNHPAIKHAYAGGYDFVNNDADPYDDNGHGTFVAGLVAGVINGTKGTLGVAPDVEIYAVKVIGADGRGQVSNIVKGVQWAIDHDAQIICMSLSLFRDYPELKEELEEAYSRGILIVAAAGNTGGRVTYPASYDVVIAVGSVDRDGQISRTSCRGPEVEVVAPGVNVLSAVPGGGYAVRNGTSYATGYVAGALALILSAHPELGADGARSLLVKGAADLGMPGKDDLYGYGLVNVEDALFN